jgi:hypothetical protein
VMDSNGYLNLNPGGMSDLPSIRNSFVRLVNDCKTKQTIERQVISTYNYSGYTGLDKYQEQCINDGSFDNYYVETGNVAKPILLGDVNGDGSITCADTTLISQYSIGLTTLTTEQKARADVNGDGLVNIIDAQQIAKNNNLSCSTTAQPFVVTFPSAGADLYQGETYNFTWTGHDVDSTGKIVTAYSVFLGNPNIPGQTLFGGSSIGQASSDKKSFTWTVPTTIAPGSGYYISFKVASINWGGQSASFNIKASRMGDVNSDGIVTCADTTLISQYTVGSTTLTTEQKLRADVNKDGVVNILDAQQIAKNNNLSCVTVPAPTVDVFTASPSTITKWQSTVISWSSSNATDCYANFTGPEGSSRLYPSGSVTVYGQVLTGTTTFSISCTNSSVSKQVYAEKNITVVLSVPSLLGDVNLDGVVNIIDAQQIGRYLSGLTTLSGQALINADVTKDGQVTSADSDRIAQYTVGIITSF